MRVSDSNVYFSIIRHMNSHHAQLNKTVGQIANMKRVLSPSDDPIAASRLTLIDDEQQKLNQYIKNMSTLARRFELQEEQIGNVANRIRDIRNTFLKMNNGSVTDGDKQVYLHEMQESLNFIVSSLNSRDEDGSYRYSGSQVEKEPVGFDTMKTNAYFYQGDTEKKTIEIARGEYLQEGINVGELLFSSNDDLLNSLHGFIKNLKTNPTQDIQTAVKESIELIDKTLENFSLSLTTLGGKRNHLDRVRDANEDVKISNSGIIRDLEGLDEAKAAEELASYRNTIQALQKTFVTISDISLFNMIRT